MATYTIKKNDTYPSLSLVVKNNGTPLNITAAASAKVIIKPTTGGAALTFTAAITDAVNGEVTYVWQTGDTATAGVYDMEVEITWAAGGIQTFPNDSYESLEIKADLG